MSSSELGVHDPRRHSLVFWSSLTTYPLAPPYLRTLCRASLLKQKADHKAWYISSNHTRHETHAQDAAPILVLFHFWKLYPESTGTTTNIQLVCSVWHTLEENISSSANISLVQHILLCSPVQEIGDAWVHNSHCHLKTQKQVLHLQIHHQAVHHQDHAAPWFHQQQLWIFPVPMIPTGQIVVRQLQAQQWCSTHSCHPQWTRHS